MAYSNVTYIANGTATQFTVPFGYIRKEHVKAYLNGVDTAFTWANNSTIAFATAPANGVPVYIERQTPVTAPLVDFADGSTLVAADLDTANQQHIYVGQEVKDRSEYAADTANTALDDSAAALTAANNAVTTANTASSNASAAVTTANAASTAATNAVTTANAASASASAAVTTANTAASNAAAALSTANTASSNASAAVSTANTASTNASAAVSTANTASTNASAAVTTANTASTNASAALTAANSAVSTANTASTNATNAVSTANAAAADATNAIAAVSAAALYVLVANVAAIPGSPSNNQGVQVVDSTGIESFTPLSGLPVGFVGSAGLFVRLRYSSGTSSWQWVEYQANDPDARYLNKEGGTMTGQLLGDNSTSAATPGFAFDGDPNTGIGRPGADELALITGGVARLTADAAGNVSVGGALSQGGNAVVVTTDSRLTDTRTPTDGTVTTAKIVDANVTTAKIADANVTTAKLADGAVTTAKIGDSQVTSAKIADGTIVNADINASAAIAGSKLQAATTTNAGAVQLTDSTSSTSTTTAATPNSVKSAYDLANAALPKAGGTISGNVDNSSTGYFDLPAGTTAQRPGSPNSGMIRFNSDIVQFEGYNGSTWSSVGGGATGGGADRVFQENDQVVTTNYTIPSGRNAVSAGPVTINSGVTVTISSGSVWTIV